MKACVAFIKVLSITGVESSPEIYPSNFIEKVTNELSSSSVIRIGFLG